MDSECFFIPVAVMNTGLFVLALILGTLSCAALGALLAAPAADSPPNTSGKKRTILRMSR
jgi:hypothetical protein